MRDPVQPFLSQYEQEHLEHISPGRHYMCAGMNDDAPKVPCRPYISTIINKKLEIQANSHYLLTIKSGSIFSLNSLATTWSEALPVVLVLSIYIGLQRGQYTEMSQLHPLLCIPVSREDEPRCTSAINSLKQFN